MPQLTLIRHGESDWNRDQRFTGWADVGLTERGRLDMHTAGHLLRRQGIVVDIAFTSMLKRCILSQWALLESLDRVWIPVVTNWRLNERHYGALTGLSMSVATETYGADAVQRWRRSFDIAPPAGHGEGRGYVMIDERYAHLPAGAIPDGESLAQVVDRIRPMWEHVIGPALHRGQRVLVTGHGNSLRALMMLVEQLPTDAVTSVEVANATPLVYTLDAWLRVIDKQEFGVATSAPSEIL
jgi:2,3-bisphosphoglycerate-dependent phosphoglycerate mutase